MAVRPGGEVLNCVGLVRQTLCDRPEQALEPRGVRVAVTCQAVDHQAAGVRTGKFSCNYIVLDSLPAVYLVTK